MGEQSPRVWKQENPCRLLLLAAQGELAKVVLESSSWWWWSGRTDRLTNFATTQDQNQGSELVHPNNHFIYDLLGHEMERILQIQSSKISTI